MYKLWTTYNNTLGLVQISHRCLANKHTNPKRQTSKKILNSNQLIEIQLKIGTWDHKVGMYDHKAEIFKNAHARNIKKLNFL